MRAGARRLSSGGERLIQSASCRTRVGAVASQQLLEKEGHRRRRAERAVPTA
jgi:hypothetical protein